MTENAVSGIDPQRAAIGLACAAARDQRAQIKAIAENVLVIKDAITNGEAIANVMLAYRHLEDASMRLGKCIQALDGGVSVYDRESTVGA